MLNHFRVVHSVMVPRALRFPHCRGGLVGAGAASGLMMFPAKPKKLSLRTRSLDQARSVVGASRFLRPREASIPDGTRSYAPMIAADDHGHGPACGGAGACLIPAYRTGLRLGRVQYPPEVAPAVPAVRWTPLARVGEVSARGRRPTADRCVRFRMFPP